MLLVVAKTALYKGKVMSQSYAIRSLKNNVLNRFFHACKHLLRVVNRYTRLHMLNVALLWILFWTCPELKIEAPERSQLRFQLWRRSQLRSILVLLLLTLNRFNAALNFSQHWYILTHLSSLSYYILEQVYGWPWV